MSGLPPTDIGHLIRAGGETLRKGEPSAAKTLFERVLREQPTNESAQWGLALAYRGLGDTTGQLAAVDQLLSTNPRHLSALIMKADHFAASGDGRAAQSFYRAAVDRARALDSLSPEMRQEVRRAEREVALYAQSYEDHLRETLAEAGFDPVTSSARFGHCLDLLLGKKQIYLQSPTAFYFPELPQRQFYERSEFPWVSELEGQDRRHP